tara:strand:+ start:482 stop:628 length:147 start_codon:yes stop_codon:yes gene_type:complete
MNIFIKLIISLIAIIFTYNIIVKIKKKTAYNKAGKKWEEVIKELSKRK